MFESFTTNISGKSRRETLSGKEYVVVPVVMLVEGVHNGSQGPLFYPSNEMAKTPVVWNHKPIVVYHPERNGEGISACDPDVLNAQGVGMIMNNRFRRAGKSGKNSLVAEAWLDVDRLKAVDERVLTAVENNEVMEVSTGLFTDNEEKEGRWGDEDYVAIARNYRPDHLAILPDMVGACSVADGAGLLRNRAKLSPMAHNAMSFSDISCAVSEAMQKKYGTAEANWAGYVQDIYPSFFIYSQRGELYMLRYTAKDGDVALTGTPEKVERVTEYQKADGSYVGNAANTPIENPKEGHMPRKEDVDKLIANTASGWLEADRDFLMKAPDEQFKKVVAAGTPAPATNSEPPKTEAPKVETPPAAPAPVANATAPAAPAKPLTVDEYIANAPAGIRDVLHSGVNAHTAQKKAYVTEITANKANAFTAEFLMAKPLEELAGLAAIARNGAAPTQTAPPMYMGAAGGPPNLATNAGVAEEPLALPTFEVAKT